MMHRTARHIIAAIAIVLTAFTATTAPNTGRLAGGTIGGGGTLTQPVLLAGGTIGGGGTLDAIHISVSLS